MLLLVCGSVEEKMKIVGRSASSEEGHLPTGSAKTERTRSRNEPSVHQSAECSRSARGGFATRAGKGSRRTSGSGLLSDWMRADGWRWGYRDSEMKASDQYL